MARGEGPGWHRESRRHHDAALKGNGYRARVIRKHEANYPKASFTPIYENGRQIGAGTSRPPPTENELRAYKRFLEKKVSWAMLEKELRNAPWHDSIDGGQFREVDIGYAGIPDPNQDAFVRVMRDFYYDHGYTVTKNEGDYGYRVIEYSGGDADE